METKVECCYCNDCSRTEYRFCPYCGEKKNKKEPRKIWIPAQNDILTGLRRQEDGYFIEELPGYKMLSKEAIKEAVRITFATPGQPIDALLKSLGFE